MSERTAILTGRSRVAAGDIARSYERDWHGEIVRADFEELTATFRPCSRWRWWWLRVRNTWKAAVAEWRNVFEVLP